MKTYRFIFSPCGPISQVPDSMAFFGALCHCIKSFKGKEALEEMLIDGFNKEHDCVVSSLLFHHTLPIPLDITPEYNPSSNLDIRELSQLKEFKKIKHISLGIYQDYIKDKMEFNRTLMNRINTQTYCLIQNSSIMIRTEESSLSHFKAKMKKVTRTRNKMNMNEDTSLFYNRAIYCDKEVLFDVYIKVKNELIWDMIIESISKIKYLSIGGKRSIGMNLFQFQKAEVYEFPTHNESKVLISKTISINDDISYEDSYYKTQILDNKFDSFSKHLYKNELLVILEGSVLKTPQSIIGGYVVEDSSDVQVYTNATGFLI